MVWTWSGGWSTNRNNMKKRKRISSAIEVRIHRMKIEPNDVIVIKTDSSMTPQDWASIARTLSAIEPTAVPIFLGKNAGLEQVSETRMNALGWWREKPKKKEIYKVDHSELRKRLGLK